jgi:hydrogenase nickel incorporation protein HypA/HybF
MHELSLAGAVIDTAERHAGGRRVTLIRLRLGELRQVVPDSLAFYFEHVARGTLCEGAALEYEAVPASLACGTCGATWRLETTSFRCPECGAADAGIESGNEFEVESIEVEEAACIG